MPFKSKAQQRFMLAVHPELAKEWAKKTKDFKKLPEHVKQANLIRLIAQSLRPNLE
jgi:hypothetical protein